MKLLLIAEHYPPEIGGVAASAGRLSHTFAALGHQTDVCVLASDLPAGAVSSSRPIERLTVHRFGRSKNVDFTLQHAFNFLEWLHRQERFDVVWAHYAGPAGFLALWFAQLMGLPSVLSIRGNDFDRQLFPPGDLARLQWCLQTCRQVITVSQDLAAKVRALSGRHAIVLPNAVDTDLFRPGEWPEQLAAQYGIQRGELVLAFSGELRAKKGLSFLIQAFREIADSRAARLMIIGTVRAQDRGEFERSVGVAAESKPAFIVTGHLADSVVVAEHLRLADAVLMPSLWDGMPNSLLEAMAVGVPVIASDAGAIPEIVTDGVHGLLLPKTHLHLLAQRVEELLALSASARRSLVEAARQRVCDGHSLAGERARVADILADVSKSAS